MDKTEARFNELVEDKNINLEKMYQIAQDEDLGDLDGVNSREIIKMYISEMIGGHARVSHILNALENNSCHLFKIWLGNPSETPTPIRNKKDLREALGY